MNKRGEINEKLNEIKESKMNYIISLTHTNKSDKFITLWRPNNAGYCYSKEMAGEYDSPIKDYHDSDDNMPISIECADRLFITTPYDGVLRKMMPNHSSVWDSIGVKMTNRGLRKK